MNSKNLYGFTLKTKSEVFERFHDFQNLIERLFDQKILAVQTDRGGGGLNTRN
jgi:hypothetical protein